MAEKLKTSFAPAERDSQELTLQQKAKIETSEFLDRVMSGTPFMFFILNEKRQVVYSNKLLMKYLGYDEMDLMVGLRTGELFFCVNANKRPGGCGTHMNCQYCGAVQAILESKKADSMVIKEAIINVTKDSKVVPMNFEISSKPFQWLGDLYFVFTMQSIAEKKRKEQLERIFFHDIINKAGNVKMFLELIQDKIHQGDDTQIFNLVKQGMDELLEDIQYQTKLQKAENGELEAEKEVLSVNGILKSVNDEYQSLASSYQVNLRYKELDGGKAIETDKVLIKRILGNLIKNAIEASSPNDIVETSCDTVKDELIFHVKNPAVMTEDVKSQLYFKSFSTKGQGRGVGTYSVKLFTEEYLKGKVEFVSEEGIGTIFSIRLPWSL